jgi:hypothetical protein
VKENVLPDATKTVSSSMRATCEASGVGAISTVADARLGKAPKMPMAASGKSVVCRDFTSLKRGERHCRALLGRKTVTPGTGRFAKRRKKGERVPSVSQAACRPAKRYKPKTGNHRRSGAWATRLQAGRAAWCRSLRPVRSLNQARRQRGSLAGSLGAGMRASVFSD